MEAVTLDAVDRRGRAIACEASVSAVRRNQEAPSGIVIVLEDVTERSRIGAGARTLSQAASALPIITFEDASLRIREASEPVAALTGRTLAQLRDSSLADLLPELSPAQLRRALQPLRGGEGESTIQSLLHRKDERLVPVQLRVRRLDVEGTTLYLGTLIELGEGDAGAAGEIRALVGRARPA
jgi:PAS domain-containing protein